MNWQDPDGQVLLGIISNVASLLVITTAAFLLIRLAGARRRQRLHTFLGSKGRSSGRVDIIVSNIQVRAGGAVGLAQSAIGFVGTAITEAEYQAATRLKTSFQSQPPIQLFTALVDQLGLRGSDPIISCDISVSPPYANAHPRTGELHTKPDDTLARIAESALGGRHTYILIGGPQQNVLSCTATSAAAEKLAGWQSLVDAFGPGEFSGLYELETSDREASADPRHRPATFAVRQIWPTASI